MLQRICEYCGNPITDSYWTPARLLLVRGLKTTRSFDLCKECEKKLAEQGLPKNESGGFKEVLK